MMGPAYNGGSGPHIPNARLPEASPMDHRPSVELLESTHLFPGVYQIKAIGSAEDDFAGRVVAAVHAKGGACIVTADHGNADEMLEEDGSPDTAHSLNPVPFIVTGGAGALDGEGILADVAPTALALLGMEQPAQMTGRSLLA